MDDIINEMKNFTFTNNKETFLIEHLDTKSIKFCTLETLNYLVNELHLPIKVLKNIY